MYHNAQFMQCWELNSGLSACWSGHLPAEPHLFFFIEMESTLLR